MWILMHHAYQEMRSILARGLSGGSTFRKLGDYKWFMPPALIPSPHVIDLSITRLRQVCFFPRVRQRESGSTDDGNVGAAGNLQQTKSMHHLFISPLIAADDSNAQQLDRWRLQHHEE